MNPTQQPNPSQSPLQTSTPHQRARLTRSSTGSPSMSPLSQPTNPSQHHRLLRASLSSSLGKVHTPLAPATRLVIPSPGPAVQWKRRRLTSSARCVETGKSMNDLMVHHWVRAQPVQPTTPTVHHAMAAAINQGDYRFAKFNKAIRILTYTDHEYHMFLQSSDWTKEETDQLMHLCNAYDLRFVVVQDRYNQWIEDRQNQSISAPLPQPVQSINNSAMIMDPVQPSTETAAPDTLHASSSNSSDPNQSSNATSSSLFSSSLTSSSLSSPPLPSLSLSSSSSPVPIFLPRTVEQLKARFYSIETLLLTSRNSSDPDLNKHPLLISAYDNTYETGRKAALADLFKRTHSQMEEMAALTLEHRKIGATIKQLKQNARAATAGPAGRKRGQRIQSGMSIPEHLLAPVPDTCIPPVSLTGQAALSNQPVYLRSAQLAHTWKLAPKETKSLENELNALSVKKAKEVIPTGPVVELYDKLRIDLLTLHNLSKYITERETMLADLRKELVNVQQRAAASQAVGQVISQMEREEKIEKPEPGSPSPTHRERERERKKDKKKKEKEGREKDREHREKVDKSGDPEASIKKKEKRKSESDKSDKDKREQKKRKEG